MATRQTLQLEELNYEYELFRENQLLTHEQLNKFIRYFEDQDRLTRTCLIGVGLVCGLTAKFKNNVLSIAQGCAVTTDGDLLKLENTDYKFFKAYSNLTRGKGDPIYDPFFPPASGGPQVKLWELMVSDKVETGDKPTGLASFKAVTGSDVDDMVALLYLEYYLSEPDDCTAIDCDHLGQLQNAKIKALLLSQQDMDKVINSEPTEIIADHIYKKYYEAYDKYFVLPELKAQRLPLTGLNTASLGALTKGYTNIIANGAAELVDAVEDLYTIFQFILDPTKYFKISTIKSKLNTTLTSSVKPFQVQYLYDFYKDIMDCYNEIRDTIYNAIYICCPDKYAFPKHIMLGIVNADLGPKPPKYRHYFYPSPAVSKNKSYLSVARSMFNRLADMNTGFTLPAQPATLRITPSVEPDKQMEWRAIPFYYKNAAALREHWSYYRTMRGTDKNVLSYHGSEYGENNSTRNPLDYDLDKNNFFRIEGHQGKKLGEAMETILDIKARKSLPFDVVAVRMDEKQQMEINLDDFSCQFDDLNAVLNAWIIEQDCLYAKTVKFFSSFDNAGRNRLPVKTGGVRFTPKENTRNSRLGNFREAAPQAQKAAAPNATSGNNTSGAKATTNYNPSKGYTYQVDDTVDRNLFLEDDTVGSAYHMVTNANIFMLADAHIGMLMQFADRNPKLQLLTPDQREIIYNIPVKLIARINEVTRFKPFEVKDLNTDVLSDYQNAIEALCDEAEASRTKAETIFAKTSYIKQGYEAQYLSALVELTENCCAADKLEALIDEIEERKRKILESLSFANYAAQHTGMEHKAGVPRGGTFILLYASVAATTVPGAKEPGSIRGSASPGGNDAKTRFNKKGKSDITDFFDEDEDVFLLELVSRKEELDVPEVIKAYLEAQGYNMNTVRAKTRFNSMLKHAAALAAELEADEKDAVSNEMVVADFCIPYLCCSDCPPMVFVMPKQKYSLALPKAIACSDEALLAFQKEPADGKIVAAAGFEDTIIEKDNTTFFDPAKVKEADFGKEITFTIDGQVTDCSIKVVKHPTAKFSFKIETENADIIVVEYTNESDDATGKQYEYEWNPGGGEPVRKVTTKDPIKITYKKSVFGAAKSFKVTLKANNSGCTSTAEQTIPLTTVQEKVDLAPDKTKACESDEAVSLTVTPATGVVACKEIPGAIILKSGQFVFVPQAVPAALKEKPLHFTVNGQDVTATITVSVKPDASFTIDRERIVRDGDQISFDIVVKNPVAGTYIIETAEGVVVDNLQPDKQGVIRITGMDLKGAEGKTSITLRVNVKDSPCDVSFDNASLIIPETSDTELNCQDLVSRQINGGATEIAKMLEKVTDAKLLSAGKGLLSVFRLAAKNIATIDQPDTQAKILSPMKDQLPVIMGLRYDKPEDQTAANVLLLFALMLIMSTVRCTDKLDPKIKAMEKDLLDLFLRNAPNIAPFFPNLNVKGSLTTFINDFIQAFVSQDKEIIEVLQRIVKMLKEIFK